MSYSYQELWKSLSSDHTSHIHFSLSVRRARKVAQPTGQSVSNPYRSLWESHWPSGVDWCSGSPYDLPLPLGIHPLCSPLTLILECCCLAFTVRSGGVRCQVQAWALRTQAAFVLWGVMCLHVGQLPCLKKPHGQAMWKGRSPEVTWAGSRTRWAQLSPASSWPHGRRRLHDSYTNNHQRDQRRTTQRIPVKGRWWSNQMTVVVSR